LGNDEKLLQRGIEEQKRLITEVENKKDQIEREKIKYKNEKEKEVEKELQKEKRDELRLGEQLSDQEGKLKKKPWMRWRWRKNRNIKHQMRWIWNNRNAKRLSLRMNN